MNSRSVLWEVHKCTILKHGAWIKKARLPETASLYTQIKQLEATHKRFLALQTQKELLSLWQQLNQLLSMGVQEKLRHHRQSFYEFGKKPGTLLTKALRGSQSKTFNRTNYFLVWY